MKRQHIQRSGTHRGGWWIADCLIALAVVVILAAALATAGSRHQKGIDRLTDARTADRLAERVLTALQTGQAAPEPAEGVAIDIQLLETPSPVPGCTWATVRITQTGKSRSLTGLIRATEGAKQ